LAMTCFLSGLTLASIGVLGFYLGRVFVEVKDRPVIVKQVYGEPVDSDNLIAATKSTVTRR
jgi:hypothetical protein